MSRPFSFGSIARPHPHLVACPACDLVQQEVALCPGGEAICSRCNSPLYHRHQPDIALALTIAALIVFAIANAFPIAEIETQGRHHQASLIDAVSTLWQAEMHLLALLVLLTTLLVPLVELSLLAFVLLVLRLPRRPAEVQHALKLILRASPWGMIEVFLLGVLVSLVKLSHLAHVVPGIALWSYAVLMLLMAVISRSMDPRQLWCLASVPGKGQTRA